MQWTPAYRVTGTDDFAERVIDTDTPAEAIEILRTEVPGCQIPYIQRVGEYPTVGRR